MCYFFKLNDTAPNPKKCIYRPKQHGMYYILLYTVYIIHVYCYYTGMYITLYIPVNYMCKQSIVKICWSWVSYQDDYTGKTTPKLKNHNILRLFSLFQLQLNQAMRDEQLARMRDYRAINLRMPWWPPLSALSLSTDSNPAGRLNHPDTDVSTLDTVYTACQPVTNSQTMCLSVWAHWEPNTLKKYSYSASH